VGVFTEVADRFCGIHNKQEAPQTPTLNDMILATSKAMDLLEGKPFRSGMKVAVIAGSIAKRMDLPMREVVSIVYAALLHDIGLVKIAADVYSYLPSGLSEKQLFHAHALKNARAVEISEELTQRLHQHPLAAGPLIASLNLSEDVASIIAAHHELCDGSGYPNGLAEAQIPRGAKILAFADVIEAVMSEVTTGLATRREALEQFMETEAVGKFDSAVMAHFREVMGENDEFLRSLATLEVENMAAALLPQKSAPLSGQDLLNIVKVLGSLSDSILSLYKNKRSLQVADKAVRLASSLGIHREQTGELAIAAMLMDLGHLGTPIGLLLKPGPLTSDERAIVQDHPVMTREILKGVPGFENIVLWCSEHHERMNGKGYPGNKKGFEISIGGRILALADVFDALTNRRPHRIHAMSPMDAIPVIGQGRMTLYDHHLFAQLRRVVLESEVLVR
jgi:HD-GYP domain-containing protein (c-di-GMP phosphodiesterase class II)